MALRSGFRAEIGHFRDVPMWRILAATICQACPIACKVYAASTTLWNLECGAALTVMDAQYFAVLANHAAVHAALIAMRAASWLACLARWDRATSALRRL